MRSPTFDAARAFQDAKEALGAAMVQDYRAGKGEEEIVNQITFVLPEAEGRALLHSSRLTHDALTALTSWMERDGPIFVFPHGTRAATLSAQWENEDEDTRRGRLRGLDEALRAVGIGCRDQETKQPTTEADLISDEQTFPELYFLNAPNLVESM
ncbi:hypothetical protein [Streptomyces chartreusis]|uniref:hypothetical protein n=1 Tax=Streptomyces chartreusis TaxID=1969 RepID=UPI0033C171C1